MQRALHAYTKMANKSRVFSFWRKLFHMRLQEKHSLALVFKGLYQQNVYRCFQTWRVHVTVFSSLLRRNAVNHAWHHWKLALAARRKYKSTLLRRVLTAWRVYFQSIDAARLLLIKRRRTLWRIVTRYVCALFYRTTAVLISPLLSHRKVKDDYLKLAVVLHKLRTGDDGIRLHQYRHYPHLISSERTSALNANFPLQHLFQELSRSNAGRNLTLSYLDASHVSVSSVRRGPALRVLTLQRKLQERCQAAGGVAMNDADITFRTTAGSTVRSPPTTTRFQSPPGKVSPHRAYAQEAKRHQQSPEQGRAGTASTAAARGPQLRGHLHSLFSPPRDGRNVDFDASTTAPHHVASPPAAYSRTPFSVSVSAIAAGGISTVQPRRHPHRAGSTAAGADTGYIPAARLFSPHGASPLPSHATPYQAARQRSGGGLPAGDANASQSRTAFLRTREML
jgi:hypothetical protein